MRGDVSKLLVADKPLVNIGWSPLAVVASKPGVSARADL